MNLETLNRGDLFQEISDLAREQGVSSKETWDELVDEVVESHLDLGELNDDEDLEGVKDALKEAWKEFELESAPESSNAVTEDPDAPHA